MVDNDLGLGIIEVTNKIISKQGHYQNEYSKSP
jgi:hypothetical protein